MNFEQPPPYSGPTAPGYPQQGLLLHRGYPPQGYPVNPGGPYPGLVSRLTNLTLDSHSRSTGKEDRHRDQCTGKLQKTQKRESVIAFFKTGPPSFSFSFIVRGGGSQAGRFGYVPDSLLDRSVLLLPLGHADITLT
ncbi:hypothetical protein WMY93_009442 [Mugilogobius chulae]|uniref:Uncharacterized protein n=1 Tax=Mugilogobius chulae TaxID=88201 RepID=A0AAW0PFB5_9GOBI